METVQETLQSFSCDKDADIERFLHERAIEFERASKARTYLICDRQALLNGSISIQGYFTICLKSLALPESMSIRKRKSLDGFSGKQHGAPIQTIPCYLIGQLGRNTNEKEKIPGKEILELALSVANSATRLVGGRWVLVECRNHEKLKHFYSENHFSIISESNDDMLQLIRSI